ncbi:MAG TPA: hypothetical protein VGQ49_11230 [Bryobacteraceae bacterium]|nr:hypothetical protein [Bryobacteraceae bacterium]
MERRISMVLKPHLVIVLLALLLWSPRTAFATQCVKDRPYTLEANFIDADIVFSGVAKETFGPPMPNGAWTSDVRMPFHILNLYKSPSSGPTAPQDVLIHTLGMSFIPGQTYIVFGQGNYTDKSGLLTFDTSPCSRTGLEPANMIGLIKQFRTQPDKLKALIHHSEVLLFTGRVKDTHVWEIDSQLTASPTSHISPLLMVQTKLTALEVLMNTTSEPAPKDNSEVTIYGSTPCSQDFRVGQEYLIFAYPNHDRPPEGVKAPDGPSWNTSCTNFMLSEDELLRKWSLHSF